MGQPRAAGSRLQRPHASYCIGHSSTPAGDALTPHTRAGSHHAPRTACRRGERYDWTDDEIWNIITNDGKSVDPFVMLHAPTFKTLNPLCMPDWASQGIEYVDDMEDWISQEGRWMSQAEYTSVEAAQNFGGDDDDDSMAVRHHLYAQLLHEATVTGPPPQPQVATSARAPV